MPRGLPRPLYDGWPVPFNTPATPAGHGGLVPAFNRHDDRRQCDVIERDLCMVCGEALGQEVIVVIAADDGLVVDDAAMHPACARLSFAWCPYLRDPQASTLARLLPLTLWQRLRPGVDGERRDLRTAGSEVAWPRREPGSRGPKGMPPVP